MGKSPRGNKKGSNWSSRLSLESWNLEDSSMSYRHRVLRLKKIPYGVECRVLPRSVTQITTADTNCLEGSKEYEIMQNEE